MASGKKSPLERVKAEFGDKEKLVDRVLGALGGEAGGTTRAKLLAASNKKLLRLLEVATTLKDKGGAEGLAQAAARAIGKAKDQAYIAKLAKTAQATPAKVLDLMRSAEKRAKAAARA